MSGATMRRSAREARGSATLFAVSCLAVLLLLGAALGVVGAMVRAHRMAQSAADLAALAAATALGRGGEPCAAGTAVAVANGARLAGCSVTGREVLVRVEVEGPHWLGQTADLSAEARAGPG
ncbi:Rv3654c family TadE-like protein [Nocardioides sp.]|uniref:Rv3654c family TadE-like protein n=1 Tax=Nocardioides sp. TaxID=35761 RepID=UPI002623D564|nr:Rv3654c family TadE-like protein [Nocardioides sp.]MDI6910567.1 flp pilus-assembly TadE/G-like family protein [Nocardioides sp.]